PAPPAPLTAPAPPEPAAPPGAPAAPAPPPLPWPATPSPRASFPGGPASAPIAPPEPRPSASRASRVSGRRLSGVHPRTKHSSAVALTPRLSVRRLPIPEAPLVSLNFQAAYPRSPGENKDTCVGAGQRDGKGPRGQLAPKLILDGW